MLFNSLRFLLFFPVVTTLYFVLPHRFRWALLLAASCVFYMAFIPAYILILAVTIVIDYTAGLYIEKSEGPVRRRWLVLSIVSTCAVLLVFKYFHFADANLAALARLLHWNYSMASFKVILPIGLSFHTFQSLSYVVEVYRGKQKAERDFGIYALYVMFYPQLVAGPIERPQNLLHQFYEEHVFEYKRVTDGLKLMAWGLFKKIVIADRLAVLVNSAYSAPAEHTGPALTIATVAFAFQIYCDFSGYSDIAIGAAQVMGFKLMENFHIPYHAASIAEFWKRWHISLSTWFRDYLYIPLGGNRVSKPRWYLNLLITFTVSGLWHGANWTYVVWGLLNGLYLVCALLTQDLRGGLARAAALDRFPRLHRALGVAGTFFLTCVAWVFFRANTLGDARLILAKIVREDWALLAGLAHLARPHLQPTRLGLDPYERVVVLLALVLLETVHQLQRDGSLRARLGLQPAWLRWGCYYAAVMSLLLFGYHAGGASQFIYFQF